MMFCLKTVKDNGVKSDICSQWGKDPVPSRSSSDSDCASPPDLDTSAVCVPRKMKVWLSHNKLTHASSALAGTCTAVTMWWHSLLCNNPSATSLCSLGSHRSLCSCAPTATVTCAGQGKAATERELLCGPGSVCSAVPSAVLSAPDAQQPSMIPAQGALRPALGWQRGEEAGPSAPFLLWMLGSSCHGGWTGCWRGLWWGCLSSNNFPFIPAVSFQLLTIAKVPFGVWFVLVFFSEQAAPLWYQQCRTTTRGWKNASSGFPYCSCIAGAVAAAGVLLPGSSEVAGGWKEHFSIPLCPGDANSIGM